MDRTKFLVHLCCFLGLCVSTGVVIYVTTTEPESVEALLKIDRPIAYDKDELTDFDIQLFRDTQESLLKSAFVAQSALRDNDINQLPVIRNLSKQPIERLSSMVEVDRGKDSLVRVSIPIPWYRRSEADQWEKVLDAIVSSYLREVVNKDRIQAGDQLGKLRRRYTALKQLLTGKSDELIMYQKAIGVVSEDNWHIDYVARKVELLDTRLVDLQLKQMTSEVRGDDRIEKAIIAKQIEVVKQARDQNLETLSQYGSTDGTAETMKQEIEALKTDLLSVRGAMRQLENAIDETDSVDVLQKARATFESDSPSFAEMARSFED